MLDERLEPAGHAARRAWARGLLRRIWHDGECPDVAFKLLAINTRVPEPEVRKLFGLSYFGEAWSALESRSPALRYQRLMTSGLAVEMTRARSIRAALLHGVATFGLEQSIQLHAPPVQRTAL